MTARKQFFIAQFGEGLAYVIPEHRRGDWFTWLAHHDIAEDSLPVYANRIDGMLSRLKFEAPVWTANRRVRRPHDR